MFRLIRTITLTGLIGIGCLIGSPDTAEAKRQRGNYWRGYWNWYDNSYRPYRYRRGFRNRYYRNNRYYRPYRNYRGRNYLYRPYRNSIQLGPLRFNWR